NAVQHVGHRSGKSNRIRLGQTTSARCLAAELAAPCKPSSPPTRGVVGYVEREDWYGELSGGEKCKVEFIRKVFLRPRCPSVLLIDEAFAPLDPASKRSVQEKLKDRAR
ncbi:unnamed protein product, partial [Prorocentrum cordatum]